MLTQKVAQTTRKSTYRPHIRKESAGVYTCQSERWTYILYTLTVLVNGHITCNCEAGSHGRPCKHARALGTLMAYNAHPTHLRPAVPTFAELAAEFAALPAPTLDFRQPAPRGAAALLELYA